MSQLLIILAFVALRLTPHPGPPPWPSLRPHPVTSAALLLAPLALLVAVAAASTHAAMRGLERRGDPRGMPAAEAISRAAETAAGVWFVASVAGLGWASVVRGLIGDPVLLDELVAIAPLLAALFFIALAGHPLERRRADARLVRALDRGEPIHATPDPWVFAWRRLRHGPLTVAVPLALIFAVSEAVEFAALQLGQDRDAWLVRSGVLGFAVPLAQLGGAVLVLALAPAALRVLWDTVRVPAGDLRRRLDALAERHGVRVAEYLIWRTGGTMVNAAVAGLLAPLRFIVISDALLERLSPREVEAVAAHEVGHVRLAHMPWLAASVLGSVTLAGGALGLGLRLIAPDAADAPAAQGVLFGLVAAAALTGLGHASRRFERQADAFAVKHLSGAGRDRPAVIIDHDAAETMADALARVARFNHAPIGRFTWRHGSIAERIDAVRSAVGHRADRLPIDRAAGRVKRIALAATATGLALTAIDEWLRVAAQQG